MLFILTSRAYAGNNPEKRPFLHMNFIEKLEEEERRG
jgi:hypothetical protein